jgi:hypothetical protein
MDEKNIQIGAAIIERIGWEKDMREDAAPDTPERFTATLIFPNGPPDLPFSIIFDAIPVRLVPVGEP